MLSLTVPTDRGFPTKQAMVVHVLREAILRVVIPPGQRIIIDEVAKQLGVSQIPVREALQILQSEGWVESRPHVGAVASPLAAADISEMFALFEGLELAAARAAISHVTDQALAEMDDLVKHMDKAGQAGQEAKWTELNVRFHALLPELARMPRCARMLAQVSADWERLRRHRFSRAARPDHEQTAREHRAMVEALRQRDLLQLEALIREHNRSALAHLVGQDHACP
jgi:DNA-binding GntR family transcriptional regulator